MTTEQAEPTSNWREAIVSFNEGGSCLFFFPELLRLAAMVICFKKTFQGHICVRLEESATGALV